MIDCAATEENALCKNWLGPGSPLRQDALSGPLLWESDDLYEHGIWIPRGFLNPPYSRGNIDRFVAWAAEQTRYGWTLCTLIIFDPSLPWFRKYIGDPCRPMPWVGEIKCIQEQPVGVNGRVKFEHPSIAKPLGANFPSVVVIFRPPFVSRAPNSNPEAERGTP